jgi:hypothetical protein
MAATRHGAQLPKFLGKEDDNLVGLCQFVRM